MKRNIDILKQIRTEVNRLGNAAESDKDFTKNIEVLEEILEVLKDMEPGGGGGGGEVRGFTAEQREELKALLK